jgi:hypothetical protein
LRGLVGFETAEQFFFAFGVGSLAQAPVAEHQVIVGLQIFRVDGERVFEGGYGFGVFPLQEEDAADLVDYYSIARELAASFGQTR